MAGTGISIRLSALDAARREEVRACLGRLLESPGFAPALRRGQLLRYLVDQALAGKAEGITEYGIGLDVFGKPSSFDTRIDSTVRAEMSRLRRALNDYYNTAGQDDPWRLDFPNRGYVPAVVPNLPAPAGVISAPSRPRWWLPAVALALLILAAVAVWRVRPLRPAIRSVVVLPFQNMTGDARNEYLADGVTEELTDSLAHIASLRVVARTSAFQFKGKGIDVREIGRRLGVDTVVEGSMRHMNGKLRLTVQVNRSADGYHILSQSFDGPAEELGRLENDMAVPVVAVLRPGVAAMRRRPVDEQAHQLYLKAVGYRGQGTEEAFRQGVLYLQQAIARDPGYADAYAVLAGVYTSGAANFAAEPLQYVPEAKAAAARAIELDPYCALAYAAQGFLDGVVLLDWPRGEQELRNALRLMPQSAAAHSWLGTTLMAQGRFDEALAQLREAESLDPLPAGTPTAIGLTLYLARRYDESLQQLTKVATLHPEAIAVRPYLGAAWEAKGEFDKAMAEYQAVLPRVPNAVQDRIAHLLAVTGKPQEARQLLASLEHPPADQRPPDFSIAIIHAALGDRDEAFQWLERAYENHKIALLKVHPMLDPLRGDPRFDALLKKAGF